MAVSRSSAARWRAHSEEGRVATGLRSRASSARQILHGIVGIACWVAFSVLWMVAFANNLPESWPLIAGGLIALFVLLVVLNFIWVRWNKRIYWRHDRRRRQAVLQEARFDVDALGRPVVAPDRRLLSAQPVVTVGVDGDGAKVYAIQGGQPAVPAAAAPLAPVEPVAAGAPQAVPAVPAPGLAAAAPAAVLGAVRIDRTPPSVPTVAGGSRDWRPLGRVELRAGGSVDTGSGLAGYQWRSSLDGGITWSEPAAGEVVAVEREGETIVCFRASDHAGNASEWSAASDGLVRQRRIAPPVPAISGAPAGWTNAERVLLAASAGADGEGFQIEYRFVGSDGNWSVPQSGSQVAVSAEGETRVAFRSTGGGLASEWAQATVRIDRGAPTAPQVSGVCDAGWSADGAALVRATGSADHLSGIARYEYRFSTDGGASWSAPAPGSEVRVEAEGLTLIQFRAVDGAGNHSAWSPEVAQ